ncbi:DUF6891 domain-containing protein [Prescottella agglutinans]|uniref:DUF6891 domain-containing protein n=1 Tax=Prescottella agglutinans TaxID=1644129 RepID=A0ABT6MK25_9NOCA|nr:hypothetical protein [Prescottella agglutinans]MDH6284667.1 hypothetical protein [Prescottella agglutinans]
MRLPWRRTPEPSLTAAEIAEIREEARILVVPGFATFDEVCETARGCVDGAYENVALGRKVDALVRQVWNERVGEQKQWTTPGDYFRVAAAFADLEQRGILARMNFTCCARCGTVVIDDERAPADPPMDGWYPWKQWAYTFFHMQDAECLGDEPADLQLSYSSFRPAPHTDPALIAAARAGDRVAEQEMVVYTDGVVGRIVVDALEAQGLTVDWNGEVSHRICVRDVVWRKPLPH